MRLEIENPSKKELVRHSNIKLIKEIYDKHPSHGYRWINAFIRNKYGIVFSNNHVHLCCKYENIRSTGKHYQWQKLGEEKDNLQYMINNYGLNNSVILLGKKLNPYNILKQADLLVSMSKYESFGNILLESVALNVPFLTTSNSGAKDICEILLKDKSLIVNSDNMYEEIKKIIDNKKHNNTRFDFNVYNKNIKDEINKLLDNK